VLRPLGIPLPVVETRETIVYFDAADPQTLPALVEYPSPASPLPEGQAYYSLPAPGRGLKAGVHHAGQPSDPGTDEEPDETVVEATIAWVRRRWPGIDPTPLAAETCFYTNTGDARFLVEAHGRVVVASACSGHGFKFAPMTGERAARLALDAAT
jgi:sarcosine oxidase